MMTMLGDVLQAETPGTFQMNTRLWQPSWWEITSFHFYAGAELFSNFDTNFSEHKFLKMPVNVLKFTQPYAAMLIEDDLILLK